MAPVNRVCGFGSCLQLLFSCSCPDPLFLSSAVVSGEERRKDMWLLEKEKIKPLNMFSYLSSGICRYSIMH